MSNELIKEKIESYWNNKESINSGKGKRNYRTLPANST